MSFGDVIRSSPYPGTSPTGIGGSVTTIWSCETTPPRLFKLDISDFSIDRTGLTPSSYPDGIGGTDSTIWHCDNTTNKVYELSTDDFSVVKSRNSPSSLPWGIGGDADTVWHCIYGGLDRVYELKSSDLSTIRYRASPSGNPRGVGGASNVIWHCDSSADRVYELNTDDLTTVRSALSPGTGPNGIGGDISTIWHVNWTATDTVYELDADYTPPSHTISGNVKDSDGNNLNGVTITFENSTEYSTTTNIDGNYSQEVDADVYTVTASITGYLPSSAIVDATVSDQIQNFVLSKPVISGNVKDSDGNNLVGVIITIEDGIDYETSTDINGNYSQEVIADIYAVTASYTGYLSSDASVDASSSDKTQDFILIKPVIYGNVKDTLGNNVNGVNILFTGNKIYNTTTDSSGDYSQVVDPDVYIVTASLSGYIPDSETVDATGT